MKLTQSENAILVVLSNYLLNLPKTYPEGDMYIFHDYLDRKIRTTYLPVATDHT